MSKQELLQQVLPIVAAVDAAQGWQLDAAAQRRYGARLIDLGAQALSDSQISALLMAYHQEHLLIEALIDTAHADNAAAWGVVGQQVRRILASKDVQRMAIDQALSLEDLAQETLADLWRGLPSFRHQSRLQTWIFTVASHCFNRAVRARRAQKRGALSTPESLELLQAELGETLADPSPAAPEDFAQLHLLADLVAQVLARQPDERLGAIFQLWAVEQQTLREIGTRLQLSVGRVHGLLAQAHAALRSDPSLRAWVGDTEIRP
jgi:RNA polymerase sigma-70 factor (ECF subfamily)